MFRVFTEKTPLYKIVAEHLEGWLETRAVAEQPVSAHIERELRSYLICGILCFGFGRARRASFLADRPNAVAALTRIFISRVERLLCTAAGSTRDSHRPSVARPRLGAVSFLHRFGSALNHHVHLHIFRVSSTCCDTVPGRPSHWNGSPWRCGKDGRISRVRYVLPRHKAANWVGSGRGRKSTRPGTNGVVRHGA